VSNQVSIRKPSKVTLSQDRLENAVAWLENAVHLKNGGLNEPRQNTKINELLEEIKELKQENLALKRVNGHVSTRLVVAINRLTNVIGN